MLLSEETFKVPLNNMTLGFVWPCGGDVDLTSWSWPVYLFDLCHRSVIPVFVMLHLLLCILSDYSCLVVTVSLCAANVRIHKYTHVCSNVLPFLSLSYIYMFWCVCETKPNADSQKSVLALWSCTCHLHKHILPHTCMQTCNWADA